MISGKTRVNIRPFEIQDLAWLKPIADAYHEWDDFIHVLQRKVVVTAFVVPGKALAILFKDDGRYIAAGITGRQGIKDFIRMSKTCLEPLHEMEIPIFHYQNVGPWHKKLYRQLGVKEVER